MSKVKVTADAAGNVIVPSENNAAWGHIRVTQERMLVDDNGFARRKVLSALIVGTLEDLKAFGYKKDQEIDGKIIFKEQLTPFNKKDAKKDEKVAGETGIVCVKDGAPIYRKNFYTTSETAGDVHEEHTNGEEIRAAYAKLKAEKAGSEGVASTEIDHDDIGNI